MIGVLFVDDEPRVLEGLRMSLRSKRKLWNMSFAEGGASALATLERTPVDVVVTDMRMPGMDGAELLRRIALQYPRTARIILSGHSNETDAVRAALVAHCFLAKPCPPARLEESIRLTASIEARLKGSPVHEKIGGLQSLAVSPARRRELLQALGEQGVSTRAVARLVEQDAGMAVKALQLVSSSFFGSAGSATTVGSAVDYLGLGTLRALIEANVFHLELDESVEGFVAEQHERARLCARVAERIAPRDEQKGVAVTAALLHNVGAVALAAAVPREHLEVHAEARRRDVPVSVVERERYGATHADVGAYLLTLWGLRQDVVDAVLHHHEALEVPSELGATTLVRIACAIAAELQGKQRGDASLAAVLETLGLGEPVLTVRASPSICLG